VTEPSVEDLIKPCTSVFLTDEGGIFWQVSSVLDDYKWIGVGDLFGVEFFVMFRCNYINGLNLKVIMERIVGNIPRCRN